jgi:predicted dehydrogenase
MSKITTGIIGCGKIAENHLKAVKQLGVEILFLVDLDSKRIENFCQKFNLNNILKLTDYKDLFSQKLKVDFVSIATDSGSHFRISYDLLTQGYNVLIEKPITLSLVETQILSQTSEKNKLLVGAIHPNRFMESINVLKNCIEKGEFGKILYTTLQLRLNRGEDYFKQAPWRGSWKKDGGGVLINQSLHNIDLLQWIMSSKPKSIKATIKNQNHPYIEAEDLVLGVIEFENGSISLIEATSSVYEKNLEESLFVFGSKGTAKLTGKSLSRIELWDTATNPKVENPHLNFNINNQPDLSNIHLAVFSDYLNALKNNITPKVSIKEASKSLEIILGIYQSALLDKTLNFPTNLLSSADFEGKFKW